MEERSLVNGPMKRLNLNKVLQDERVSQADLSVLAQRAGDRAGSLACSEAFQWKGTAWEGQEGGGHKLSCMVTIWVACMFEAGKWEDKRWC